MTQTTPRLVRGGLGRAEHPVGQSPDFVEEGQGSVGVGENLCFGFRRQIDGQKSPPAALRAEMQDV